ncbi:MAG: hypothetical protein ABEI31_06165 [Halodesulfurarchaeum sp.]
MALGLERMVRTALGDRVRGVERHAWGKSILWGIFAYSLHKYGALVGWYVTIPWFQNLTHAISASAVALLLWMAGLALGYRGRNRLVFAGVLTIVAAIQWEFIEYLGVLDQYGVYLQFHGFDDAAVDMVSNLVGLGAALFVLHRITGQGRSDATRFGPSADDDPAQHSNTGGQEKPLQ